MYPGEMSGSALKFLEFYPEHTKILLNKGCALHSMGKYAEAIICYNRILVSEPKNKESLANKGAALNKLGEFEEATKRFNKAME